VIDVLRLADVGVDAARALLSRYALSVELHPADVPIPGSYWGETEAGLIGRTLHARADTPLHSVLHEAAHFVCMSEARRSGLERDAGGDDAEENAVCYLQIVLADELAGGGRDRMWQDMDRWGYTFRLGSAERWFREDAADACIWLQRAAVLDAEARLTFRCRQ
jgi:hypothetical protein